MKFCIAVLILFTFSLQSINVPAQIGENKDGKLVVDVFGGAENLPLDGAIIYITKKNGLRRPTIVVGPNGSAHLTVRLSSGAYHVRIVASLYVGTSREISIESGTTKKLSVILKLDKEHMEED